VPPPVPALQRGGKKKKKSRVHAAPLHQGLVGRLLAKKGRTVAKPSMGRNSNHRKKKKKKGSPVLAKKRREQARTRGKENVKMFCTLAYRGKKRGPPHGAGRPWERGCEKGVAGTPDRPRGKKKKGGRKKIQAFSTSTL